MDAGTRLFVRGRAGDRCEYCQLSQEHSAVPHQIEHIVARQHGGSGCALVPRQGKRTSQTLHSLMYRGAYVKGLTASDRTTVAVLALNDARRLELREELLRPGGLI